MSLQEYQELQELKDGMTYDPEQRRLIFHYAYNEKVNLMQNNQKQAEKRAVSQENSLRRKSRPLRNEGWKVRCLALEQKSHKLVESFAHYHEKMVT